MRIENDKRGTKAKAFRARELPTHATNAAGCAAGGAVAGGGVRSAAGAAASRWLLCGKSSLFGRYRRFSRAARSGAIERVTDDFRLPLNLLRRFSLPIELFLPYGSSCVPAQTPCHPSNVIVTSVSF